MSGTLDDLRDYRVAAQTAIQDSGCEAVLLDDLSAQGLSPLRYSLQTIAECDALVGLIAWRYGYIPTDDNPGRRSFVELEVRHAWELGKPTLIFLVHESVSWLPKFIDRGEPAERLRAFREEILRRVTVGYFVSAENLRQKVMAAVSRLFGPEPIPTTVDRHELAWRLIVDFKADPALLRSMDDGELRRATETWAHENSPNEPLDGPRMYEFTQEHLRAKQANLAPSSLWLAWMRATDTSQHVRQPSEVPEQLKTSQTPRPPNNHD